MTITAAKPSEQNQGWNDAFDRMESEQRGPEKPAHVLNARQLEFNAHVKRMMQQQKEKRELV